jgi:hypothetical protein
MPRHGLVSLPDARRRRVFSERGRGCVGAGGGDSAAVLHRVTTR